VLGASYTTNYTLIPVERGDLDTSEQIRVVYRYLSGWILHFATTGTIAYLPVADGDFVSEGDFLCGFEVSQYENMLESYQTQLASSQLSLKQLEERKALDLKEIQLQIDALTDQKKAADADQKEAIQLQIDSCKTNLTAVSEQYADQQQQLTDQISILEKRVAQQQEEIAKRQIYSPCSGIVEMMSFGLYDDVTSEDVVLYVNNRDYAYFVAGESYFTSGEIYSVALNDGTEISARAVYVDCGSETSEDEAYTNLLELVDEDAFYSEATMGKVTFPGEIRENVLYTRVAAVEERDGQSFVYLVDENGNAYRQDITVGMQAGIFIEVTSGLEEGDEVVVQ
jgi:multidrug efflux pump subunit AcrA (membrane-fusion protein)